MRTAATTLVFVVLATTVNFASAQTYARRGTNNGTPVFYRHASTYTEGALRGWADLARGIGDYNYNTSIALINREEAISRHYDNEIKKTQTYFEKRRLNKEYRDAEHGPRKTNEDMARYLAKTQPLQLTAQEMDRVLKRIYWPTILQSEQFQADREAIELVYASRTVVNSGPGSVSERQLQGLVGQMRAKVKRNTRAIGANGYITANRFLDGLELEAARPEGTAGLASVR